MEESDGEDGHCSIVGFGVVVLQDILTSFTIRLVNTGIGGLGAGCWATGIVNKLMTRLDGIASTAKQPNQISRRIDQ